MAITQQILWHTKTIPEVFDVLGSREHGLTKEEASERFQEYGLNKLPEGKVDGLLLIFLRQFQSPLIYILFFATGIVFAMGEAIDASIIFVVLLFNAIVGTIQEGKAQNTLLALKKFAETSATVLRDGRELIILDTEVMPGDIIVLQEGEKVPADARIIFANALKIDEASLTGESEPVTKTDTVLLSDNLSVTDQKNMIFKGTHILSGNGTAVVVATGLTTEIGKIAQKISSIDTEIPLKTNIRYLSRVIIVTVAVISTSLIVLGVLSGKSLREMFTTAVALSVSIIPEGLPIVMTLVLATGVHRMSKRNVLVKRLQAVEALGQTKVIAVDKTGTLTRNEMVIQRVYVDGKNFSITGNGYEPNGEVIFDDKTIDPLNHPELLFSGRIAAFCANARLSFSEETKLWKIAGDPTEAAMLVLSEKIGFHHDMLEQETPKIFELPFNYQKKYHVTIRAVDDKNFLTIVGAPEKVLELCKNVWHKDGIENLNEEKKKELELAFHNLAQNGFRVVAYAINPDVDRSINSDTIPPLTFVGFFGMNDALRPEVKEAMQRVRAADMRVVMITGDHILTAQAIAKEADIWREGDNVLTGEEIDKMSDEELSEKLARTSVFARVTPEHKLRIIQAYRKRGEIVAMTGDGVNDAPSLVAADLGVAMGKIGTEVAKEASDIVLLDDNFASIVSAAEEGRGIYKTIKKVILYLFSTNIGEVLIVAGALVLGYPLPLLAAQIIWLNFVTDGFLDVALAMEPKEKGLMQGKFERPKKWIVDGLMAQRMFFMALPMAIGTLYLFSQYFEADITKGWTIALTTMAVFQWFNAWNCRSESKSIFQMNPFSNKFLAGATVIVIFLQFAALYTPFLQKILHTTPLSLSEWLIIIPVAFSIILVEEIRKFFYRRKISIPV
ncbi:HAD-IC family P-type ATPase [Patescibacteria group bacterium]|nr:HAD-IC family P-type ATPase [Patescibacteria group bacterium]MBU0897926.1 HAD-IC family P-type ATPase [Patescibacteria group bacterium]MBU1783685.1 HAD-IC family P-type ATPase [Patescibacteria group bacterium]